MDLGFIIDGSGSIGQDNFKKVLDFVKDIVRNFDISQDETHIGLIVYDDDPQVGQPR